MIKILARVKHWEHFSNVVFFHIALNQELALTAVAVSLAIDMEVLTQQSISCSKSRIETIEKRVKPVQS